MQLVLTNSIQWVSSLIDGNNGTYNEPLIRNTFVPRNVLEEILHILLLDVTQEDDIIWQFDP